MSTSGVLLVEDHGLVADSFAAAFPNNCDWCRTVGELKQRFPRGHSWKYAFVDFDLGDPTRTGTGLGVLSYLREHAPDTKIVVLAALTDNGRRLFSIAAFHWFGARMILDKAWVGASELQRIYQGENLTPPLVGGRYSRHARLIDSLFMRESASKAWKVWPAAGGDINTAVSLIRRTGSGPSHNTLKMFRTDAMHAVSRVRAVFFPDEIDEVDTPSERVYTDYSPLLGFAKANSNFFSAPELETVLSTIRPWRG